MRIAYTHQIFTEQRYGGISRYYAELASSLEQIGESPMIFSAFHQNEYLRKINNEIVSGYFCPIINNRGSRLRHLLGDVYMKATLPSWKPDIIHDTFYRGIQFSNSKAPRLVTVYDMIYERFAEFDSNAGRASLAKRQAIERADHVICISHSTRSDLIEFFGTSPEKISVVHLGCHMPASTAQTVATPYKPYLLFVGSRAGIKNFSRLLEAFVHTGLHSEYDLVLFGGGELTESEKRMILSLKLGNNQVRVTHGGDDVLAGFYSNARAFVYPSLHEGFGLPLLEAMAMGCPIASSNSSSLPEVAGSAAEYFDPVNIEEMAGALTTVLTDETRRSSLILEGYSRIEQFTWTKTAVDTQAVYRKLVG